VRDQYLYCCMLGEDNLLVHKICKSVKPRNVERYRTCENIFNE
jgi:hypothetical protein